MLLIQLTQGATRIRDRSQNQAAIYSHSKVGERLWKKLFQLLVSGLDGIDDEKLSIVGRGSFGTRAKGGSTGRKAKRERERERERENPVRENPVRETPERENPKRENPKRENPEGENPKREKIQRENPKASEARTT
jgi:hypothetical protein